MIRVRSAQVIDGAQRTVRVRQYLSRLQANIQPQWWDNWTLCESSKDVIYAQQGQGVQGARGAP